MLLSMDEDGLVVLRRLPDRLTPTRTAELLRLEPDVLREAVQAGEVLVDKAGLVLVLPLLHDLGLDLLEEHHDD